MTEVANRNHVEAEVGGESVLWLTYRHLLRYTSAKRNIHKPGEMWPKNILKPIDQYDIFLVVQLQTC